MKARSAILLSAATLAALSCGERFASTRVGSDDAGENDGSAAFGGGGTGGAPSDERDAASDVGGAATGGSSGSAGAAPSEPVEVTLEILRDADDATWINGSDERLFYGANELNDEVGSDAEMGRIGLRFTLPVPRGATVTSARLKLYRVDGDAAEDATMRVQVYDAANVAPFDDAHTHSAPMHAPEGVWAITIGGFAVGAVGSTEESPDLSVLLQHVVELPEWSSQSSFGIVISPDDLQGWAAFADSAAGNGGASLRVVYTPPP